MEVFRMMEPLRWQATDPSGGGELGDAEGGEAGAVRRLTEDEREGRDGRDDAREEGEQRGGGWGSLDDTEDTRVFAEALQGAMEAMADARCGIPLWLNTYVRQGEGGRVSVCAAGRAHSRVAVRVAAAGTRVEATQRC